MPASDGQNFSNFSANTASFPLLGGKYEFIASATWSSGSLQVQTLSPDGSTWIPLGTALSANGGNTLDLEAGMFRLGVTGSPTAIYASLMRINE